MEAYCISVVLDVHSTSFIFAGQLSDSKDHKIPFIERRGGENIAELGIIEFPKPLDSMKRFFRFLIKTTGEYYCIFARHA